MLIRKGGSVWQEKERGCWAVYSLSFAMILIRNVKEKEGGMFIFSIMAGLYSHLSLCVWYSGLLRQAILLSGGKNKRISHIYLIFQPCCNKLVMKKNAGRKVMCSPKQQVHNISFMPIVCFHVLTRWQTEYKPVGNKCWHENATGGAIANKFNMGLSIAVAPHHARPSCKLTNFTLASSGEFLNGVFLISGSCTNWIELQGNSGFTVCYPNRPKQPQKCHQIY